MFRLLLSIIFLTLPTLACSENRPAAQAVRKPAVAGQFYPGSRENLSRSVDQYLKKAKKHPLTGKPVALLVPHAGYVYSGAIAAEGFKSIGKGWKKVIIIGSSHHYSIDKAALYGKGSFKTPIGEVPVDTGITDKLLKSSSLFEENRRAHRDEHSLEVEIPFLQEILKNFSIVPILVNSRDLDVLRKIGEKIAEVMRGSEVLLVISSDLSHYPEKNTAREVDLSYLEVLKRMDPEYLSLSSSIFLERGEKNLGTTCCGQPALIASLYAVKKLGGNHAQILKYMNSGDVERIGDPDRAVGYAAVAFTISDSEPRKGFSLSKKEKNYLLAEARRSISDGLNDKKFNYKKLSKNPALNSPAAVFVTLTQSGDLRGCIGTTMPRTTLLEGIRYFARQAAFHDPRFRALGKNELGKTHIEISILSNPWPVRDSGEIVPGKHGVIVQKGYRSGLFLPTVWDQLPEKEDFLSRLCSGKAGLPPDCWKDPDVKMRIFTTDIFEEH